MALDFQDKIDLVLEKVAELGICPGEAENMRQGARDLNQASLNLNSAYKNLGGASVTYGGSAVVGAACFFWFTGVGLAACAGSAAVGFVGGALWTSGSMDSVDSAKGEYEDAYKALDKAVDNLCRCIAAHMQQ